MDAVPAFRDNYIWLLSRAGHAAVIDPGDAAPVQQILARRELALDAVVVTHHHADHVGGVEQLAGAHGAHVYGPAASPFATIHTRVHQGDRIRVLGEEFAVLDVPGHTLDHIAYWSAGLNALFCGDTLFACGCGRLFEGTAPQMFASLGKLRDLPDATAVYCAHEYTAANIRFALAVEPGNTELVRRSHACTVLRQRGEPTVPSTIALEKATNPFLRCEHATVRAGVERHRPGTGSGAADIFAALRAWKDVF
jgi:hydroxyacylglutathione hydrolase